MATIAVQDIQRDLIGFLARIEQGETIVIVRDERPVAEVKPLPARPAGPRPYGLAAGEFVVPADFDQPLPDDVLKDFEGE